MRPRWTAQTQDRPRPSALNGAGASPPYRCASALNGAARAQSCRATPSGQPKVPATMAGRRSAAGGASRSTTSPVPRAA